MSQPDVAAAIEFLAREFFRILRPNTDYAKYPDWFERVKGEIDELREEGFSSRELIARMHECKERQRSGKLIEMNDLFSCEERAHRRNLLVEGPYHHNELKVVPPPMRFYLDPDYGYVTEYWNSELGRYSSEYYPEPVRFKERYTLENLLEYFYRSHRSARQHRDLDRRALVYLLKIATLDEILFAIDASTHNKRALRDAIQIEHYLDEGRTLLDDAKEMATNMRRENERLAWQQDG